MARGAPPSAAGWRIHAGALLLVSQASARAPAQAPPAVTVVRAEEPPLIDGVLDDQAWRTAAVIDAFRQVEPVEDGEPSERTEVLLLYDADALYVAFRCHDHEPGRIIATTMSRDADLEPDDRVAFVIDTFLDRRNAFSFEMNPAGAKVDGLVEENTRLRLNWDSIWYGRASIDEGGWVAEMAIPCKSISFDRTRPRWGFNAERVIRRRNETVRWSAPLQNRTLRDVAEAGTIEGLAGMKQGVGLDLVPFGLSRYRRQSEDDLDLDAGLDAFYRFTPNSTLALTVNTDFAETEVDERRINLTRFPLFFPEKRAFFLQDAGIFDFGGIRENPLPFFSRRIGIGPDGEERDILAGAKLTGREGPWNFGALAVQMKDDPELGDKFLAVGRASLNVLEESTLGLIGTAGDPSVHGDNFVAGADFNYRYGAFAGNKIVTGHLWALESHTDNEEADASGSAFGVKLGYPNDRVDWGLGYSQIDDEFDAALGFVPRRGIREYFGDFRLRWRPGGALRSVDAGLFVLRVTNLDDEVESEEINISPLAIETESDDSIEFRYSHEREVLVEPFEIVEGIVLPGGDYRFDRWHVELETSPGRPLSLGSEVSGGEFFNGTRLDTLLALAWRPSPHLFLGVEYEQGDVDLDQGDFITRIARVRSDVFITPDLTWSNFIQYDNESDSLGLNSRFRWIIEPGSEFFFVVNQSWEYDEGSLSPTFTEITTKLKWTFRF